MYRDRLRKRRHSTALMRKVQNLVLQDNAHVVVVIVPPNDLPSDDVQIYTSQGPMQTFIETPAVRETLERCMADIDRQQQNTAS